MLKNYTKNYKALKTLLYTVFFPIVSALQTMIIAAVAASTEARHISCSNIMFMELSHSGES